VTQAQIFQWNYLVYRKLRIIRKWTFDRRYIFYFYFTHRGWSLFVLDRREILYPGLEYVKLLTREALNLLITSRFFRYENWWNTHWFPRTCM